MPDAGFIGNLELFPTNDHRTAFLGLLGEVSQQHNWLCHAYCLMGNHYHLLVETPDGNLLLGMRQPNGVYTQKHNRRHGRVGHVFQGRYKAILVERESYLLELARYIGLNSVRAQMVHTAVEPSSRGVVIRMKRLISMINPSLHGTPEGLLATRMFSSRTY